MLNENDLFSQNVAETNINDLFVSAFDILEDEKVSVDNKIMNKSEIQLRQLKSNQN